MSKPKTATEVRIKQLAADVKLNKYSQHVSTHVADSMAYAMEAMEHSVERNRIAQEWNRRYYEQTPTQRWEDDVENPPAMTKKMSECDHIPDHVKMMIDRVTEDGGKQDGRNFVWLKDWETFKATLLMMGVVFQEATDKFPEADCPFKVPFMGSHHVIGVGHAVNITDLNTYYGIKNGTYDPHGDRVFD